VAVGFGHDAPEAPFSTQLTPVPLPLLGHGLDGFGASPAVQRWNPERSAGYGEVVVVVVGQFVGAVRADTIEQLILVAPIPFKRLV
jgi:hypothetical protein